MQHKERRRLVLLCVAISTNLLGHLAEAHNSELCLVAALALTLIYASTCNNEQLASFMLLLVAPNRLLTLGPISAPALVMLVGVVRMSMGGKSKISREALICSILILTTSILAAINGRSQLLSSIKVLIVLCFIRMYFPSTRPTKRYIEYVENCSLGCIITSTLALVINPRLLTENVRFSLTGSGGENVLGILCAVMIINLLIIVFYRNDQRKVVHVASAISLLLVCFLTGSRTAFLCLIIGIIGICVLACIKLQFKHAFYLILLVVAVGGLAHLILNGNEVVTDYVQRLVYRTQKLANSDISNGRFEIWKAYFEVLKSNPRILWFGGMNQASFGINIVAHNMILEQLVEYGIIGSFLILILYCVTYSDVINASDSRARALSEGMVPVIALLVASMFSHTLIGIPQTMMLFVSAYGLLEAKL